MNYYIELTLIESPDTVWFELWSKVYTQLHIAFAEHKDDLDKVPFGVSFPQYKFNIQKNIGFLGTKIRVFSATENELKSLDLVKWLERLLDHVHLTQIRVVPQDKVKGYSSYYRVNEKMNIQKRVEHQAKRRNISIDEATQYFQKYAEKPLNVPYIVLKSLSAETKHGLEQLYRLYIGKSSADLPAVGKFGTYGLSRVNTVPEF